MGTSNIRSRLQTTSTILLAVFLLTAADNRLLGQFIVPPTAPAQPDDTNGIVGHWEFGRPGVTDNDLSFTPTGRYEWITVAYLGRGLDPKVVTLRGSYRFAGGVLELYEDSHPDRPFKQGTLQGDTLFIRNATDGPDKAVPYKRAGSAD